LVFDLREGMKTDFDQEVTIVKGITDVLIVLQQTSRNLLNRWREVTFAGILRIPFPVAPPAARQMEPRTASLFQSVRGRMRPDSAPSQL
jgi:hypothetical protein